MATPPTNASVAASAPGTSEITPAIEDSIIAGAVGTETSRAQAAESALSASILADVQVPVVVNNSATGTVSIAFAANGLPDAAYQLVLTGTTTLSLSGGTSGYLQRIRISVKQDATGGHVLTLPSGVLWQGGVAPTPNTVASKTDVFHLETTSGGTIVTGY